MLVGNRHRIHSLQLCVPLPKAGWSDDIQREKLDKFYAAGEVLPCLVSTVTRPEATYGILGTFCLHVCLALPNNREEAIERYEDALNAGPVYRTLRFFVFASNGFGSKKS